MKKQKKKSVSYYLKLQFFFVLTVAIGLIAAFSGITYYNQNLAKVNDSSLDGSEIVEEQQVTVPNDVAKAIIQEKLVGTSPYVLGAKSNVSVRVPILMYHYVEYVQDAGDKMRISLNTPPSVLENEIKTLADAGYTFMTNKELDDVLDGKATLPKKPIVLTFDDGYRDFYTDAYPILKKYHVKATQYVISGFLDRPNHLLTNQLEEIAKDGLVEIGAHTVHHVWLKGGNAQTVQGEVAQSRATIEQLIHRPVTSFAYPFGAFDEQARQTVKIAGFRSATSTIPGTEQKQENRYFWYRLRPGGRTGQYLLNWLQEQTAS